MAIMVKPCACTVCKMNPRDLARTLDQIVHARPPAGWTIPERANMNRLADLYLPPAKN